MNIALMENFRRGYCPEYIETSLEEGKATSIAFNRRGTFIAAGCEDGKLMIYDLNTLASVRTLSAHSKPITGISWMRNGRFVLTVAAGECTVHLWDLVTSQLAGSFSLPAPLVAAQLHPRRMRCFVACMQNHEPVLVDLDTGQISPVLPPELRQQEDAQAPGESQVDSQDISAQQSGEETKEGVGINETSENKSGMAPAGIVENKQDGDIKEESDKPDSATRDDGMDTEDDKAEKEDNTNEDNKLEKKRRKGRRDRRERDRTKERERQKTSSQASKGGFDRTYVASFDRRGSRLFIGTLNGEVVVLEFPSLQVLHRLSMGQSTTAILHIVFGSKDGPFLVNTSDRLLRVYNSETYVMEHRYQDYVNRLRWKCCCFSTDDRYVIAGSAEKTLHHIYVFDGKAGGLVKMLEGPKEGMVDMAWHPTRTMIASCAGTGCVYLWGVPHQDNWAAYAPNFTQIDENEEYVEAEDEFDIDSNGDSVEQRRDKDMRAEDPVDVCAREPIWFLHSSDEEADDEDDPVFLVSLSDLTPEEDEPPKAPPARYTVLPLPHETIAHAALEGVEKVTESTQQPTKGKHTQTAAVTKEEGLEQQQADAAKKERNRKRQRTR